jgi:hypothetical protein
MESKDMVTIGQGSQNAVIKAPLKSIDLTEWLFTLKDGDYMSCSTGHNGMVQGRLPDGRRVSVSVETIGGNFIVNNFIEEVSCRDHVRSVSDSVVWIGGPGGVFTTKPKVTWELKVAAVSEESCMLACNVTVQTDDAEFLGILRNLPPSDSDPLQEHWIGETPFFAADIEKKALSGMFG